MFWHLREGASVLTNPKIQPNSNLMQYGKILVPFFTAFKKILTKLYFKCKSASVFHFVEQIRRWSNHFPPKVNFNRKMPANGHYHFVNNAWQIKNTYIFVEIIIHCRAVIRYSRRPWPQQENVRQSETLSLSLKQYNRN